MKKVMSISREDFMKGNFDAKPKCNKVTNIDKIIRFLRKKRRGYKVDALAKILKMKKNTIRGSLRQLMKEKEVLHKKPFFLSKK